jgi:hemoglobin
LTPWPEQRIFEGNREALSSGNKILRGWSMAKTLYERLGGIDAITAVVEDFRDRVAKDDRINLKFARTDLARLTKMLIDQVCEATGGPCHYNGRSMKDAHAGMKVTKCEFNALVDDLVATLKHFKVPSAEQDELLAILGPLKSDIVAVDSNEVGTALPDEFRPAPALIT